MNRYLVDTHALISWAAEPHRLSDATRLVMATGHNQLLVSTASLWEIAIKQSLGKLSLLGTTLDLLTSARCSILQITFEHLNALSIPPWHHKDPFDRMLIAQAFSGGLTVVTSDRAFTQYDVKTLAA